MTKVKDATLEQILEALSGIVVSVNKADELYDIDFLEMPLSTLTFNTSYGSRQYLNDAVAGVNTGTADARKKVEARLAKMKNGECEERAARESDPVMAIMKKTAKEKVLALYAKKGFKESQVDKAQLAKNIDSYIEKNDATLRPAAEKLVAAAKAARQVEIAEDFELEGLEE